jgi:hypothetical protein
MNRWHALAGFLVLSMLFPSLILLGGTNNVIGAYAVHHYLDRGDYVHAIMGFVVEHWGLEMACYSLVVASCWVNALVGIAAFA